MNPVKRYLLNVAVWLDQGANCLLLLGSPDETVSSRAAKAQAAGKRWGCVLCRFLSLFQQDHCRKSLQPYAGADAIIPDDQP